MIEKNQTLCMIGTSIVDLDKKNGSFEYKIIDQIK